MEWFAKTSIHPNGRRSRIRSRKMRDGNVNDAGSNTAMPPMSLPFIILTEIKVILRGGILRLSVSDVISESKLVLIGTRTCWMENIQNGSQSMFKATMIGLEVKENKSSSLGSHTRKITRANGRSKNEFRKWRCASITQAGTPKLTHT